MISQLISLSLKNRYLVLLLAIGLFGWGVFAVQQNPVDAIPDLSENQVIVFTEWPGRSPQLMEDQVTYPLVSNLQGIPDVKTIRGTSMFGMSFVYVVFKDKADVYWARTRVLERLNYAQRLLPQGVTPTLGPDGTGVGHVLWYTLDVKGMNLGEQRALQDWYIKLGLQTVPGVSEVASFGGFEKQYQVNIDPHKLDYYKIPLSRVLRAIKSNNNDVGGRKFEMNGTGYIVRGLGYIKNLSDVENISVGVVNTIPVLIKDIATVQMGGDQRLGIFDRNGNGEAVGGIVVMRYGENAEKVIAGVKAKMADIQKGLPSGVKFHIDYDRSELVGHAVASVKHTLIEEMITVSLIVLLFLFSWRSALSIIIQIPITVATSFILLNAFGISSNIMSLTGIALAIGVIVDNGIVMAENAHRSLALAGPVGKNDRLAIIERSCKQVGRGVFFSTLIIVTSFLPVFMLSGQEGKLFGPLAWTKTFILGVDAVLAVTLAPVLISFFLKGKLRSETENPLNRALEKIYHPLLNWCLRWRKTTLAINLIALLVSIPLLLSLGSEFMPPLDEGSILFMPVTQPDISNTQAKQLLQVQDKIIKSQPEVADVLGKAGRANTATDNAPLSMTESIILLKPRDQWRKGITKEDIVNELNAKLQIPGVVNGWTQPIINRINMLSTGIRTDVGLKVYGQNLDSINALCEKVKDALQGIDGVKDLYAEPINGGRYLDIVVNKEAISRYGLSIDDVNEVVESALGGVNLTTTVEGRQRFSVNARFAQDYRDNLAAIKRTLVQTPGFGPVPLSSVADINISDGPAMIQSENAQLRGTVLFNVRGRDLGSTVKDAQEKLNSLIKDLPQGYYFEWSGQYENMIRAEGTLRFILPIVLLIIFGCLYLAFHSVREAFFSLISIPFALIGGAYMVYFFGVHLSVAVAVGFIALFGIAVETGIVMVIYLNDAMQQLVALKGNSAETITRADLRTYVMNGAVKRLRPKLMTVCVALFGLVPILWATGTGSDVMRPIVLPMIGGVLTSSTHILLVTPLIFLMVKEYELKKHGKLDVLEVKE
ncbi:efflux RND transporter permease subunit [Mucilaginibacter segetis]|uniref:Efflux RND transporter permease subunit n=1 Tax=Mucilaginibacter segetis TaxID=2793071 RepID=A0A934PR50_9SPHI|nr:CusA/CzcA family heavy metal efflux RND transporter [Mucilaginibacter segetis]MBK0379234.1 efflux RND transporter permease subunit [Mucilaginibacter segetis]